ncbi:MAG: SEL1-like repeat protein [Rhodobacteraceae bacterium]|nr:SEL1-like repeat protein [Paracoccaceae bacterium]
MKNIIPASAIVVGLMTSVAAPALAADPGASMRALVTERRAQALAAEAQGDFDRAHALLRVLASAGDPSSMWRFSRLLQRVEGGSAERDAALYWLHRAAEAGENGAQRDLNRAAQTPGGVSADGDEALARLKHAAKNHDAEAQYQLATLLEAVGPHQNSDEAAMWLEKANTQGHGKAVRRLSVKRLRTAAMAKARAATDTRNLLKTAPLDVVLPLQAPEPAAPRDRALALETTAPRLNPRTRSPEQKQPAVAQVQARASLDTASDLDTADAELAAPATRQPKKPRAEQLYRLGRAQFDGAGEPDRALAFALWREAATLGHARAATAAANLAAALSDAELSRAEEALSNLNTATPQ